MNQPESCKCPSCNGILLFDIPSQMLQCKKCGRKISVEKYELKQGNGADSAAKNNSGDAKSYVCSSCGGTVCPGVLQAFTRCPFCHNPIVFGDKIRKTRKPDIIIPFKKSRDDFAAAFRKLCSAADYIPKDFLTASQNPEITAKYYPFWIYDIEISGSTDTNIEHVDYSEDTGELRHECYKYHCGGRLLFSGIPQDARKTPEDNVPDSTETFLADEGVPYREGYLSGLDVTLPDLSSRSGYDTVYDRVKSSAKAMLTKMPQGFISTLTNEDLKVHPLRIRYALFPVWEMKISCKKKEHRFVMNGQTGELTGRIPVNEDNLYIRTFFLVAVNMHVTAFIIYAGSVISEPVFIVSIFLALVVHAALYFINGTHYYKQIFDDERRAGFLTKVVICSMFLLGAFFIKVTGIIIGMHLAIYMFLVSFFIPVIYWGAKQGHSSKEDKSGEKDPAKTDNADSYYVAGKSRLESPVKTYQKTYTSKAIEVTLNPDDSVAGYIDE